MMQVGRRRAMALATGVLMIATACSPSASPAVTGGPGGSGVAPSTGSSTAPVSNDAAVTILVSQFGNERFDPGSTSGEGGYGQAVHATLIESNEKAELVPGIASAWEVSEDGLTWTFTIRDDVKFHNGETLTAEDVAFSLADTFGPETIANSTIGALVSIAEDTESVTATGPNTVVVKHKSPIPFFAFALSSIDANFPGAIFPKAYFEQVGRDEFNRAPIGAGPFKITSFKPGESIVMERFDDYYNKERLPKFKTLTWNLVPELATRVQALQAGQADLIEADLTTGDQITSGGNQIAYVPESAYIRFNLAGCWKPELPCSDIKVRQALDLALDKTAIMSGLYGDAWTNAGWAYVSPSSLGYTDVLAPRAADVAAAQQLMTDAGFPGGEGFPALTVYTADDSTVPRLPDLALLLEQQWEANLGIDVNVEVGDRDATRVRWLGRELDGGVYMTSNGARWDGAGITRSSYGDLESETRHHEDPAIIDLVTTAQQAVLPDDREAAYAALYPQLRDFNYEIGMGSLSLLWGLGPRVSGWSLWPLSIRPTALWTISVSE